MDLPLIRSRGAGIVRVDRDARLRRVRRGWYVDARDHEMADRRDRYLTAIAAVAAARPAAIFARESALALAGLPFGAPVDVFTIGDPATSGRKAGVRRSHVQVDGDHVVVEDGIARCSSGFALADLARRGRQVDAVSALDAALAGGLVELSAVAAALELQGPRGQRRASWVLEFADARSESVGSPGAASCCTGSVRRRRSCRCASRPSSAIASPTSGGSVATDARSPASSTAS